MELKRNNKYPIVPLQSREQLKSKSFQGDDKTEMECLVGPFLKFLERYIWVTPDHIELSARDLFEDNLKNSDNSIENMIEFNVHPRMWVCQFIWIRSNEGYDFWERISHNWQVHLNNTYTLNRDIKRVEREEALQKALKDI